MKKAVLTLGMTAAMLALGMQAQAERRPMLEQGKTWYYTYHHYEADAHGYDDEHTTWDVSYRLRGDTTIAGQQYIKMYRRDNKSDRYFGAYRENEEGRVYMLRALPDAREELVIDFNLNYENAWVKDVQPIAETINVYGKEFRRYKYKELPDIVGVEGVGFQGVGLNSPFVEHVNCICDYEEFDYVESNGFRFTNADFIESNDYHPLLEEGKEWICHTQNPYNGQVYDFRYYLGEEVERHGHVYRELTMENYGNYGRTERCAYLREEGQKVYVDYLGHKVLLYDFGMKVGDRIQGFASHTELGSFNMLEVISEDTIEVGGVKRRRLGLAECSSPDDTPTEAKGYWVEGIGSSLSPVCTAGWSPVADPIVVTSCRLNGNELISASDFGRLIESPYPLETSLPYRPMFEEGKRWAKRINYHHEERENRQTIIRTWEEDKDLSYVVRGDTVIEDETWKKVYYETEDTTYLVGWGMDKDRNVWFYDTREKKTIHLYDFNLMKYNHVFPDEKGSFLDRVEAVECRGNMLNAYYLSDRLMQPNDWIACVEGVRFRMGLLPYELDYILTQWEGDIYTIITPRYIGCYEDDECIFSLANFNDLSATDGIEPTQMVVEKPRKDGYTYDLQGRRVAEGHPLQRGIYVKDGRKFVVK
jgi:hypothetical protein